MASQGAGGAYEISGRMTAMLGWAGTAGFAEDWVFDGAADRLFLCVLFYSFYCVCVRVCLFIC